MSSDGNTQDGPQQRFRRAWSLFATGVTLITTEEPGGAVHAMTATGVMSASLIPPLTLVCVGRERNTHRYIKTTGRYGLSILSASQKTIAAHYARPPEKRDPRARFDFMALGKDHMLKGALAAMSCRVVSSHEAGDHTIFVAEVEETEAIEGHPLVFFRGGYGDVSLTPPAAVAGS